MNSPHITNVAHRTITTSNIPIPSTWLEVNKSAFDHNIAYYKNLIGTHNKLAIVIKGNGYGHGLQEMSSLCEKNNLIDWICVAQLSEALSLQNITKPILVLGYADANLEDAINKNINFMVDSIEYAQKLNTIGKKYSHQFNVHIKIDTGLSRMGILIANALDCINQISSLDFITINGIYSHFAASDTDHSFTQKQVIQFNGLLEILNKNSVRIENIHMSNSASINNFSFPTSSNFFRLGLGTYGLGQHAHALRPVLSWKARIAHIKTIPAESYVSYASTYKTNRPTRIALLPVGYYDGYDFRFSNKVSVMINGFYAPIIGRVAMNVTIVDITDVPANIDDVVTLLGEDSKISAHELAQTADITNVRELLTGINPRINRIITS